MQTVFLTESSIVRLTDYELAIDKFGTKFKMDGYAIYYFGPNNNICGILYKNPSLEAVKKVFTRIKRCIINNVEIIDIPEISEGL